MVDYLTARESDTANEVFAQYALTAPGLALARSVLPVAMEARAAIRRASSYNFQGPDAYHAAHTVAAHIEGGIHG